MRPLGIDYPCRKLYAYTDLYRLTQQHRSSGSEGYLVDVYENGILLRGRDFAKGEWMPIATYWIDTTLQTVEAGTYKDPMGTITT